MKGLKNFFLSNMANYSGLLSLFPSLKKKVDEYLDLGGQKANGVFSWTLLFVVIGLIIFGLYKLIKLFIK